MKILFIARKSLFEQAGGDSLQVEQTAQYLRMLGHEVTISTQQKENPQAYDILHFFNLIRPAQFLYYLKFKKTIVITSIYVDYFEYESKKGGFTRRLILNLFGKFGLEYFKTIARWLKGNDDFPGYSYLLKGQKSSIQAILEQAKEVIVASDQEASHIKNDFGLSNSYSKIALGSEHFKTIGGNRNRDGIACIARIEGLKNQHQLIEAVNDGNESLSLIGKAAANQSGYYTKCQKLAGHNIHFTGQLEAKDIAKILSETQVHAMISYYETTGLSTIEALKAGCQVVISDRGGQKEIFGDHVFYADPENVNSIKDAISKAQEIKLSHMDWVMKTFSWEKSAQEISDIYKRFSKDK